jgi:hypothetical protein
MFEEKCNFFGKILEVILPHHSKNATKITTFMRNVFRFIRSLVVLLTLPVSLWAIDTENKVNSLSKVSHANVLQCSLPAPTGLTVTNTTASTVTIQWSPVVGAIGYQIEAEVNGVPFTVISSIGPMATIVGLPSDVDVDIWVSAICSSNEVSSESAYIRAQTGIIIEIIYEGAVIKCDQTTLLATFEGKLLGNVILSDNTNYKAVLRHKSNPGQFVDFYVKSSNTTESIHFIRGSSYIQNHQLHGLDVNYNCIFGFAPAAYITNCSAFSNPLVQMTVKHNNNLQKVFQVSNLNPDYNLTFYSCTPDTRGAKSEERDSGDANTGFAQQITVAPNPFTNTINVQYPDNSDILRLKLYDLRGKLCFEKEYHNPLDGGAVECVIDDLADGVYFLNATTGNAAQTFKLVKKS